MDYVGDGLISSLLTPPAFRGVSVVVDGTNVGNEQIRTD